MPTFVELVAFVAVPAVAAFKLATCVVEVTTKGAVPEATVEVKKDGKPLGLEAGSDIMRTSDGKTIFKIKEARLYKVIQGRQPETHVLEFIIQEPGLRAFTFTFG